MGTDTPPDANASMRKKLIFRNAFPVTDDDPPFSRDMLNRLIFAERLSDYVGQLKDGAVIAIDAPWGEGKTWFGNNWAKLLDERGHKVMSLDAFAHDYIEDPFLAMSAVILDTLREDRDSLANIKDKAVAVAKALTPIASTVAVNLTARWIFGSPDITKAFRNALSDGIDASSSEISREIEGRLTHFKEERACIDAFRDRLAAYCAKASSQGKPVVFFIDELDRCRPSYAVQLIERIKHFFEVPNLVFVLLINRHQLERAITGVYGEIDSSRYLGKFLSMTFRFPGNGRVPNWEKVQRVHYVRHIMSVSEEFSKPLKSNSLARNGQALLFPDGLGLLADIFGLSLRDIEDSVALFALSQHLGVTTGGYFALVVVMKIAHPDLFRAMREQTLQEFGKAAQMLMDWVDRSAKTGRSSEMSQSHELYQYVTWLRICEGSLAPDDETILRKHEGVLRDENPSITLANAPRDGQRRLFYLELFMDLATRIECGMTADAP